jgi:hypothetical protein
LLSNEHRPVGFRTPHLNVFPVPVGHCFARRKPWIKGALEFLKFNDASTHVRVIVWLIFSDHECHEERFQANVGLR